MKGKKQVQAIPLCFLTTHACPTLVSAQRPRYVRGDENRMNSENLSRSAYPRNFFQENLIGCTSRSLRDQAFLTCIKGIKPVYLPIVFEYY